MGGVSGVWYLLDTLVLDLWCVKIDGSIEHRYKRLM